MSNIIQLRTCSVNKVMCLRFRFETAALEQRTI